MGSTNTEVKKTKTEYATERVQRKIDEYRNRGSHRAQGFFIGQGFTIGIGALIRVLTVLSQAQLLAIVHYQLLVGGLGSLIVIITGLLQLRQNLEGFRIYRRGAALLERERCLYQQGSGEYSQGDEDSKWNTYVQNIERLIFETEVNRLARFEAREMAKRTGV